MTSSISSSAKFDASAPSKKAVELSTTTLTSSRLTLEWFSPDLALTISTLKRRDDWADDFPTAGEFKAAAWVQVDGNDPNNFPFLTYALRDIATGLLFGGAGFHGRVVDRSIELGYGLAPSFRRQGRATEACAALVRAAFASNQVDQVIATTDSDNAGSQSVLKNNGFISMNDLKTYWVLARPLPDDFVA